MKQLRLCLAIVFGLSLLMSANIATAETQTDSPSLIISEIKIKNDTSTNGYDEFIELYNSDITSLNLNNFTVEYFKTPAPGSSDLPVKKVIVADGLLLPTETIILAANKLQIPNALDSPFSSLNDTGGLVLVRSLDGTVQDQVAWTSTPALALSPVLLLSTSTTNRTKSFIRNSDDQGNLQLINPTWQLLTPTPVAKSLLSVPLIETEPEPNPLPETGEQQTEPTPDPAATPITEPDIPSSEEQVLSPAPILAPPQITELLPNPAAPASDSTDEFIELYNPNDQPLDLKGYRLQSGNTFSYSYSFDTTNLAAHEYRAFLVTQTGAILSNTSSQVQLLDPTGTVVGQTNAYDSAAEGEAWALINSGWQWTTTPTPGEPNIMTTEVPKAVGIIKAPNTKTASATKTTPKATAATKPKATTPVKAAKTTTTPDRQVYQDPAVAPPTVHPAILAGVGILTLLYAGYEYRYDMVNAVRRFQRHRNFRREARPTVTGR